MTTNCCPNSISKELHLKKLTYGSDDFESWSITAQEVSGCLQEGYIPLIKIADAATGGPKIAVILGQDKHPDREEKDYSLHPDYARVIIESGGEPYFIAYDKIAEQLNAVCPDGIFLIGGVFNSPAAWYDTPVNEDTDKRGQAYLAMLDYAREHNLPVLGICGGMQMLAGYLGAKMKKCINTNLPPDKSHKQNGEKIAHKTLIAAGSLLSSIIGQPEIMTNSAHNEAVIAEKCGQCAVTAKAEDGIAEAVEPVNGWNKFLLGVQWHPERLFKQGDISSKAIFKSFIESCKHD